VTLSLPEFKPSGITAGPDESYTKWRSGLRRRVLQGSLFSYRRVSFIPSSCSTEIAMNCRITSDMAVNCRRARGAEMRRSVGTAMLRGAFGVTLFRHLLDAGVLLRHPEACRRTNTGPRAPTGEPIADT
jgi:hypothetical protein